MTNYGTEGIDVLRATVIDLNEHRELLETIMYKFDSDIIKSGFQRIYNTEDAQIILKGDDLLNGLITDFRATNLLGLYLIQKFVNTYTDLDTIVNNISDEENGVVKYFFGIAAVTVVEMLCIKIIELNPPASIYTADGIYKLYEKLLVEYSKLWSTSSKSWMEKAQDINENKFPNILNNTVLCFVSGCGDACKTLPMTKVFVNRLSTPINCRFCKCDSTGGYKRRYSKNKRRYSKNKRRYSKNKRYKKTKHNNRKKTKHNNRKKTKHRR